MSNMVINCRKLQIKITLDFTITLVYRDCLTLHFDMEFPQLVLQLTLQHAHILQGQRQWVITQRKIDEGGRNKGNKRAMCRNNNVAHYSLKRLSWNNAYLTFQKNSRQHTGYTVQYLVSSNSQRDREENHRKYFSYS